MKKRIGKRAFSALLVLVMMVTLIPLGVLGTDAYAAGAKGLSSEASADKWVSGWSTSMIDASLSELGILDNFGVATIATSSRVTLEVTASGSQIRLVYSNEYGLTPLTVSACSVAKTGNDSRVIKCGTLKLVTFGGKHIKSIPAGQTLVSDPVKMDVTAGEKLTVTTYFRSINVMRNIGLIGADSYAAIGNFTLMPSMYLGIPLKFSADSGDYEVIPALKEVDVLSSADTDVCVVFGDSTVANDIPQLLAEKLRDNGINNISVTQEAIKGNRLVANGVGKAAKLLGAAGVDRFESSLAQPGVKYIIVKLGVNDCIHPYCASKAGAAPVATLDDMIAGYNELIDMAHAAGVKIFFCEVTPWKGYTRNVLNMGDDVQWTPEIDQLRLDINEWLAGETCPSDGYIELSAMHDPADDFALIPSQTPDGAHHNLEGQKNLVAQIPLDIFG